MNINERTKLIYDLYNKLKAMVDTDLIDSYFKYPAFLTNNAFVLDCTLQLNIIRSKNLGHEKEDQLVKCLADLQEHLLTYIKDDEK